MRCAVKKNKWARHVKREKHRTGVEGWYGGGKGWAELSTMPYLYYEAYWKWWNFEIENRQLLVGLRTWSTWTNWCLALPNQGSLLLAKVRSAMMSWGVRFKYVQIIQIVSRPFYTFLNSVLQSCLCSLLRCLLLAWCCFAWPLGQFLWVLMTHFCKYRSAFQCTGRLTEPLRL